MNKIKSYIKTHKKTSIFILIIVIALSYWGYKKITSTSGDTRYVTAKVEKGTIISSVSGTGQVSAYNQIDIKSKTSGDVTYLAVKSGQEIRTGALIAQLDAKDAQKTIRDAEISLENAKLSLEKLKLQNSEENMNADLEKAYDDGFTTVSNAFLDLPLIMNGLEDLLAQSQLSENTARSSGETALDYREQAEVLYYKANDAFFENRINFRKLDRNSINSDIESNIDETYVTSKLINDAVKTTRNFVDYLAEDLDNTSAYSSFQDTLSGYTSTMNGHISSLLSIKTSIKNYKDAFPTTDLDIQSSELSVQQKINALQDAKEKLADYSVRAPFDGTIATIDVKKNDSVSSGTLVATLITQKQIAEISMNEVDVAKIKTGARATLTFDAIEELTITGEVVEIDSVGAVEQGVVTYNVKISFDTQDERVKPAMSVSASIITEMKQDVLTVPNSAIKSQNNKSYVEVLDYHIEPSNNGNGNIGLISKTPPKRIAVETGISNDFQTEIISGLEEGDEIITRTILPTTTKTTTAPSIFGSPATTNKNMNRPMNSK
ncbi:efflux RND transporter periplasmic adaptor subunit [Patescibacteria group bacterium]|nr:efflux RND transporter periplasmic adaptor subunit [Patescibacteria group bacterium]